MVRQSKRVAFSLIALFAVTTSMFRLNIGDALLSSFTLHRLHSTKTDFTGSHDISVLLAMEEADSEEAVDGEDADDGEENLRLEFDLFIHFDFASFQNAVVTPAPNREESSTKGYHAPIYLENRNFRI
jgi:hypothetical protein